MATLPENVGIENWRNDVLSSMTMRWTLDEREVHVRLSLLLSGKRCDGQKKRHGRRFVNVNVAEISR